MSILFSDEPTRDGERAYTHIDHGLVRVGNQWLERVWSGFTGRTTSLLHKPGEYEWAAAKNPEFSVDVDGNTLSIEDFGEVEWSEVCDDLGASLVGAYRRPEIEVRIEQLAFHDAPGLLRTATFFNCGRREVKVGPAITESFELDQPENCEYQMNLRVSREPDSGTRFSEIGAVITEERGLILLAESKAQIVLGSQDLAACSVRIGSKEILAPSQLATQARSLLIAFEGDSQAALDRHLPEILRRMRLHDRMMAKREREDE